MILIKEVFKNSHSIKMFNPNKYVNAHVFHHMFRYGTNYHLNPKLEKCYYKEYLHVKVNANHQANGSKIYSL